MSKIIKLTQGYETIVDDDLYEELNKFKWRLEKIPGSKTIYVVRDIRKNENFNFKKIYIHKYILFLNEKWKELKNKEIDHIDGNGLNNQIKNLRICSHAENLKNLTIYKNNTSQYKGVSWHKHSKKWYAYIRINGTLKSLGYFSNKIDAAKIYNTAAIKYFGEFAKLNNV